MEKLPPDMQKALKLAQLLGQNGDSLLVHINKDEAQLLDQVTDGGRINPNTGLLAFDDGDYADYSGSGGTGPGWSGNGSGPGGYGGADGGTGPGSGNESPFSFDPDTGQMVSNPNYQAPPPQEVGEHNYHDAELAAPDPYSYNPFADQWAMENYSPRDQGFFDNMIDWARDNKGPIAAGFGGLLGGALAGPFGAMAGHFAAGKAAGMGTGQAFGGALGGALGGGLGGALGLGVTGGLAGSHFGGKAGASFDDPANPSDPANQNTEVAANPGPDPFNNVDGYNQAIVNALTARQRAA